MKLSIKKVLCYVTILYMIPTISSLAQSGGGVADSDKVVYESAIQLLRSASLVDQGRLVSIQQLFTQAGVYQFSVEYRLFIEALLIMLTDDVFAYDDAFNTIDRIKKNEKFIATYQSNTDNIGMQILPDLGDLEKYIKARKMEAYGDIEGAIIQYDQYPVLDATERAQTLESDQMKAQYRNAVDLLEEGTFSSCMEAAAIFEDLGSYRDSQMQLDKCKKQIERLATPTPSLELPPTSTLKSIPTLMLLSNQDREKTIAASRGNTIALKSDGTVFATGNNGCGQCNVGEWTNVASIAMGYCYSIGVKTDGTVVATGGINIDYSTESRKDVRYWNDIVSVAAGEYHTVGLKADGTVMAVGSNQLGQCNVKEWTDIVAIAAGSWGTFGLKADGTVVAVGDDVFEGTENWTDIVDIVTGAFTTVGIRSDGTVVAVGQDSSTIMKWTDIIDIATDGLFTVGLKSDGTVVAVGDNTYGQCDVKGWRSIVAIAVGMDHTVGLRSDGTIVTAGLNEDGQCNTDKWRNIRVYDK